MSTALDDSIERLRRCLRVAHYVLDDLQGTYLPEFIAAIAARISADDPPLSQWREEDEEELLRLRSIVQRFVQYAEQPLQLRKLLAEAKEEVRAS